MSDAIAECGDYLPEGYKKYTDPNVDSSEQPGGEATEVASGTAEAVNSTGEVETGAGEVPSGAAEVLNGTGEAVKEPEIAVCEAPAPEPEIAVCEPPDFKPEIAVCKWAAPQAPTEVNVEVVVEAGEVATGASDVATSGKSEEPAVDSSVSSSEQPKEPETPAENLTPEVCEESPKIAICTFQAPEAPIEVEVVVEAGELATEVCEESPKIAICTFQAPEAPIEVEAGEVATKVCEAPPSEPQIEVCEPPDFKPEIAVCKWPAPKAPTEVNIEVVVEDGEVATDAGEVATGASDVATSGKSEEPAVDSSASSSEQPKETETPAENLTPEKVETSDFSKLISLQKEDGSWDPSSEFVSILGVSEDFQEHRNDSEVDPSVWATLLAVIWLHHNHLEKKAEWELPEGKAVSVIKSKAGSSLDKSVKAGNKLLKSKVEPHVFGL
ncbi:uncharacterized protein LOC142110135 [Mixophyes fleayi]|uniref:uncharacterized protein LOC142110135 n=1 Tax=Mixophyes fleayi TaxID=3061075 RepID=UPI003F4E16E6